jgi:hypothetical protein
MRNTITVMNAKGGVGKSTLVLALAETLSAYHDKDVLIIDADAQASISHLLMPQAELDAAQSGGRTIVDYLAGAVLKGSTASWREFVIADVSDVDDARSIALIPSDTGLTLFEREVSKGDHEARLRGTIAAWLEEAGRSYDIVLIDSAPGLSVLTECLLREADFYPHRLSQTMHRRVGSRSCRDLSTEIPRWASPRASESSSTSKTRIRPRTSTSIIGSGRTPNTAASINRYRWRRHCRPQGVWHLDSARIWPNTRAA